MDARRVSRPEIVHPRGKGTHAMASAEELAELRDRLGALGDDPTKASINKLARACRPP